MGKEKAIEKDLRLWDSIFVGGGGGARVIRNPRYDLCSMHVRKGAGRLASVPPPLLHHTYRSELVVEFVGLVGADGDFRQELRYDRQVGHLVFVFHTGRRKQLSIRNKLSSSTFTCTAHWNISRFCIHQCFISIHLMTHMQWASLYSLYLEGNMVAFTSIKMWHHSFLVWCQSVRNLTKLLL